MLKCRLQILISFQVLKFFLFCACLGSVHYNSHKVRNWGTFICERNMTPSNHKNDFDHGRNSTCLLYIFIHYPTHNQCLDRLCAAFSLVTSSSF